MSAVLLFQPILKILHIQACPKMHKQKWEKIYFIEKKKLNIGEIKKASFSYR